MDAEDIGKSLGKGIEVLSTTGIRKEFRYSGTVHANRLPDGWEFVGFGSGWFAISET